MRSDRGREGTALFFGVFVLTMVATLGLTVFKLTLRDRGTVLGGVDDHKAALLAEAGLNEAIDALRAGGSGGLGSMNTPVRLGGGLFWVEATPLISGRIQLSSTGLVGSGRASATALVQPPESNLFEAVLNTADTLNLAEGVVIDSYRSTLGSYASQAVNTYGAETYAGSAGAIRSNSDIQLGTNGLVFGDATPGVGDTVTYGTGSYVSGSDAPAEEDFVFPPIEEPVLVSSGNYSAPTGTSTVLPAGQYRFDTFTIPATASLRIEGPAEVVVDSFDGKKDGLLEIDARLGAVTFYCLDSYTQAPGFEALPVVGSPMAVGFMIKGTKGVQFNGGTSIRGAFYAPNGAIKFASGCEFWGSLAASRVGMANGMHFHFDEDLASYWDDGGADSEAQEMLNLVAWFETGVSPQRLLIDRRDPYVALGIDRADALGIVEARALQAP